MENPSLTLQRTIFPGIRQRQLSDIHITPNIQSISQDLSQLREAIDAAVHCFALSRYGISPPNLHSAGIDPLNPFWCKELQTKVNRFFDGAPRTWMEDYPIGQCTRITNISWELIDQKGLLPQTEGFSHLKAFIDSGGLFRVIWGGIRNVYFQTAFQAGTYYFDIANDTVDVAKPKIDHALLDESGFHDIESYKEYMQIKSSYQGVLLFANNFMPGIFPYFPLFVYSQEKKRLGIDNSMYMARLNIAKNFRSASAALEAGCFDNGLDEAELLKIEASLRNIRGKTAFEKYMEFRAFNKEEMTCLLQEAMRLDTAEHVNRLKDVGKTANFINFLWEQERIYSHINTT